MRQRVLYCAQSLRSFACNLRVLMLLAALLAASWGHLSDLTGRFGTDPYGDSIYQQAATWSRIDTPDRSMPSRIRNSVGMQLVLIPAGRFVMGSPTREEYRSDDERPHRVKITRPFYLGAHELTVGQFRRFVEATGYRTEYERRSQESRLLLLHDTGSNTAVEYTWRDPGFVQGEDHPVVVVSWNDTTAFCQWLSQLEGCRYRLPTEAEWEYACRAGTVGPFSIAHEGMSLREANICETGSGHWAYDPEEADSYRHTAPIGRFQPNALGLHDVHGNVAEWCADWYGADYYLHAERCNPKGPDKGIARVSRGASFVSPGSDARSANRAAVAPFQSYSFLGFRVVRECGRM